MRNNLPKKIYLIEVFLKNHPYSTIIKSINVDIIDTYDGKYPYFSIICKKPEKEIQSTEYFKNFLTKSIKDYLNFSHGKDFWISVNLESENHQFF
jgi:hypothetical protein